MGQILIQSTVRDPNATVIFDPSTQTQTRGKLNLLRSSTNQNGNVGGRFALPPEFDSKRFASSFAVEGNEAEAMMEDQQVIGTGWVSDGWRPWKFPANKLKPTRDEDGEVKKDEKGKSILDPHPNAGKVHKVKSLEREGPTYVLMCRPIEVQNQVNEAYGLVSIDNMAAEARGDTIAGDSPTKDPGMLGAQRLGVDREVDADRQMEETIGRSAVVQSSIPHNSERLTKPPQQVGRR